MSNLGVLDLRFNYLQGSLPALPLDIIYLDYSSNNMGSIIPPNIGDYLSGTVFLSFSSNNLHGNIPKLFCSAPNLQVLDLSNNYLIGMIPKCLIAMNGTLSILNLGRNKLTGTIGTFPGLCDLRTLDLHGNFLQGKIPKYLVSCVKLEVLDLRNNQINDQFPCWLKGISTLHVLNLRSNKLQGSLNCSGTQVAWPHLQIIDLAYNNFSCKIPPIFFETLKEMKGDANDENLPKLDYLQFEILEYPDRVTVTSKNLQIDLVKILTIFTSVDFSCNNFEGPIPTELGQLRAIHILNLSHNAFWGHIPSSLATLNQLECLDISNNSLSGEIPTEITNLSFLSFLNLSYNHLVGKIPTGTQIQTFEASSFIGNEGLCGPPLTQNCSSDGTQGTSQPESKSHFGIKNSIDWSFLSIELGFAFGIGIVLWPLAFWKQWRIWYWEHVDELLYQIFPELDFVYECRGGKN